MARTLAVRKFERQGLAGPENGTATPASAGVPFERLTFSVGASQVEAWLVSALPNSDSMDPMSPGERPDKRPPPAILLVHGIGETLSKWAGAQAFLARHGVTSLIVEYATRDAAGRATVAVADAAIQAAYAALVAHTDTSAHFVLGFSMGAGATCDALPRLAPAPDGVILVGPISSLRDAAAEHGTPRLLTYGLPDVWSCRSKAGRVRLPLLVVRSDSDHVNSEEMARRILAAAVGPSEFALVQGKSHNALYVSPDIAYWGSILDWVSAGAPEKQITSPPALGTVPPCPDAVPPLVLHRPAWANPHGR